MPITGGSQTPDRVKYRSSKLPKNDYLSQCTQNSGSRVNIYKATSVCSHPFVIKAVCRILHIIIQDKIAIRLLLQTYKSQQTVVSTQICLLQIKTFGWTKGKYHKIGCRSHTFVLVASLKPVPSEVRKEELDDDHDHENDIDREFDEARRAKLKYA